MASHAAKPFDVLAVARQEAEALQRKNGAKKATPENWLHPGDWNNSLRRPDAGVSGVIESPLVGSTPVLREMRLVIGDPGEIGRS
jgi:hypothetical protein